jgi:hypothetical protein
MTAWILVGGFGGAVTGYATSAGSVAVTFGAGVGGVLVAVIATFVVQLTAAPSRMDDELRGIIRQQAADDVIDARRRALGQALDRLVVEAGEIYRDAYNGRPGFNLEEEIGNWRLRLRVVLISYGVDFEWRWIDTVEVIDQPMDAGSRLLADLEARKQRLLQTYRKCSSSSPNPLRPTSSPDET